jgi:hypothetical protein
MGKCVRISVGAALPLLREPVDGIIIGSGNGGLEDCIKFLDQIIQYEEGMLTPANFVQSTANAMAAQIGMMARNQGYNSTHVQRGLAFECALLDAMMFAASSPSGAFLLGGADEISTYNNNIEILAGSFKSEIVSNSSLYDSLTPGSLAGEGAAFFRVSGLLGPIALLGLEILHETDPVLVRARLEAFLQLYGEPDLLLSGENGDSRLSAFYNLGRPVVRFKHLCGEYPTASSFGIWLACHFISTGRAGRVLLYNTFKGAQHSFVLLGKGVF